MKARFRTIAAVVGFALLIVAATASAHYTDIFQQGDKAWVDDTHDHANVRDNTCDQNPVYVRARDGSGARDKYDPDGCGGFDGHLDGINFYDYRLCEVGVSCTAFKNT